MSFELYLKNIKSLAQYFGLKEPIELDDLLGATFICSLKSPMMINVSYDMETHQVLVDTLVATNMPSSRLGIQTIMNQLVGDLLIQNPSSGRLVACPEEFAVKLVLKIDLQKATETSLADAMQQYLQSAQTWKDMFSKVHRSQRAAPSLEPKEVLSFEKFSFLNS